MTRAQDGPGDERDTPDPEEIGSKEPGSASVDLSTTVKREFVVQVILLNLALLAIALGAMLYYFRGWADMGFGLVIIGLVSLLAQYRRYRQRPPHSE